MGLAWPLTLVAWPYNLFKGFLASLQRMYMETLVCESYFSLASLQRMSMETLVCESYFSLASLQRMSMATLVCESYFSLASLRECPCQL